jgi:Arc/MetJ-type ribon-helix-helix transcriptional regulator
MSATDKEKLDELASGEAYKDRDEAVAAALNDLNARMKAAEDRADDPNIGSKTADELNVQKLLIGGKDIGDSLDGIGDSLDGKVDKVNGKGLSTNDFTTEYMNAVYANTQARHTHVYMTDAEIDALWDAAKSAASNAS